MSFALEKIPALPEIPPFRIRANGSCTCPQSTLPSFCFFGRCNPVHPGTGHRIDPLSVLLLYGRQIIRVLHSQYIEDIFFCKVSQALPGNGFDDMLQSDVIKATILKFRLRFKFTFASGNILHQSFGVGRTIFFLQFGYRCIRRET